jgi:hypothetical protein
VSWRIEAAIDAADYLDNAVITEYLSAAVEIPIPTRFSPRSATWPRRTEWPNRERHIACARREIRRGPRPAAIAMIWDYVAALRRIVGAPWVAPPPTAALRRRRQDRERMARARGNSSYVRVSTGKPGKNGLGI